jgi:hypothetical protein
MEQAGTATAYAGEADIAQIDGPRPLVAAADGAEVFGLQVVGTPGHTAGHITCSTPIPACRLAELPVRTVYFGHGDPLQQGTAAALRRLAATG